MRLTKRKGFIFPLALMVFSAASFAFLVWLSVNHKGGEDKANRNVNTSIGHCVKSGCSSEVCAEEGNHIITTCLYLNWYACLPLTKCERQANGQCGWTENIAYLNCLKEKKK